MNRPTSADVGLLGDLGRSSASTRDAGIDGRSTTGAGVPHADSVQDSPISNRAVAARCLVDDIEFSVEFLVVSPPRYRGGFEGLYDRFGGLCPGDL